MKYNKKFIHFHFLSTHGSGNNLIINILKNYEIYRVSDNLHRLKEIIFFLTVNSKNILKTTKYNSVDIKVLWKNGIANT